MNDIEFRDDNERQWFAEASLGESARSFLSSEVGQFLKGCAIQDIEDAAYEMLSTDPQDLKKLIELQIKAKSAQNFFSWINEAINNGDVAHEQLKFNQLQ